jgi:mono/diheme cytochrome c family protein
MRSMVKWVLAAGAVAFVTSASAEVDKKIERTWKAKCASCHGVDGKGQTEQGKKMLISDYTAAEWQKGRTDEQLKKNILEGVKWEKKGVKQEMDGYKEKLQPEQVDGLVQFIRALK